MDYNQILARRIQELCELKNISLEVLSQKAKISERTLRRLVKGLYKNPGMATIFRIAYALDMTLAEFLDFPEINEVEFSNSGLSPTSQADNQELES